jgi:hypothetical protein
MESWETTIAGIVAARLSERADLLADRDRRQDRLVSKSIERIVRSRELLYRIDEKYGSGPHADPLRSDCTERASSRRTAPCAARWNRRKSQGVQLDEVPGAD